MRGGGLLPECSLHWESHPRKEAGNPSLDGHDRHATEGEAKTIQNEKQLALNHKGMALADTGPELRLQPSAVSQGRHQ